MRWTAVSILVGHPLPRVGAAGWRASHGLG